MTHGTTGTYTTLSASERRLRCAKSLSESCSLLMTPPSPLTRKPPSRDSSLSLRRHTKSLVSPSVSRRQTSWFRMSAPFRSHPTGGGQVHIPRFHNLQQPIPRCRAQRKDRQSSSRNGPPSKACVGQPHADPQHKDEGMPSVCAEHPPVWQ